MKLVPPYLIFNHNYSLTLLGDDRSEIPNNNKEQTLLLSLDSAMKDEGTSALHTEDTNNKGKTLKRMIRLDKFHIYSAIDWKGRPFIHMVH